MIINKALLTSIILHCSVLGLTAQDEHGLWQDDVERGALNLDSIRIEALRDSVEAASRRIREAYVKDSVESVSAGYRSLCAAWRETFPFGELDTAMISKSFQNAYIQSHFDSLSAQVDSVAYDESVAYAQPSYRLPIVMSGEVPYKPEATLAELANQEEIGTENLFARQLAYTQVRQWETYQYGTQNIRKMKLARGNRAKLPYERTLIKNKGLMKGQQLEVKDNAQIAYSEVKGLPSFHADKWHTKGTTSFQMSQTSLSSNWYKGGENNLTLFTDNIFEITRYDENKITTFETVLELKLSGYHSEADTVHDIRVNDNQFTLNMKYGYKAWKNFYYSANLYAKTPIFEYFNANSTTLKSTFLAPLEVNVGIGMDYSYTSKKKGVVLSVMLAPLSYNLKYVNVPHRVDVTSFGIDADRRTLNQFGSTLTTKLVWMFSNKFQWSSRLYIFTSYKSLLGEFENTFTLKLSSIFSAKLYLYPRFDDSQPGKNWQMKENAMLGVSFDW